MLRCPALSVVQSEIASPGLLAFWRGGQVPLFGVHLAGHRLRGSFSASIHEALWC